MPCLYVLGASQRQSSRNCGDLLKARPDAPSGRYWLDLDGGSSDNAFIGYCDMATNGGGWTLVWAYTFTNFDHFTRGTNDVTPWPSTPTHGYARVRISTSPPQNMTDFNAVDFALWKDIGSNFMLTSNLNHWISCSPDSGSLVHFTSGSIRCHNVRDVSTKCLGNAPSNIYISNNRAEIRLHDVLFGSIFYLFEADPNYRPVQDPCSSDALQPGVSNPIDVPHGNIFIR